MNKVKLVGNVVPLKSKDTKGKETDISVQPRQNSSGETFYSITFKVITEKTNNHGGQWILCSMTSDKDKFPFKMNTDYYLEGHIRSWSKDGKVGQSIQIDSHREITMEDKRLKEELVEQSYSGSSGL
jgi:hypothetical protein